MDNKAWFELSLKAAVEFNTRDCYRCDGTCLRCKGSGEQKITPELDGRAVFEETRVEVCPLCEGKKVCGDCGGTKRLVPGVYDDAVAGVLMSASIGRMAQFREAHEYDKMHEVFDRIYAHLQAITAHYYQNTPAEEVHESTQRMVKGLAKGLTPEDSPISGPLAGALTPDDLRELGIEPDEPQQ